MHHKDVVINNLPHFLCKVYFTNGLIDPWRMMGIQSDVNEHSPADIIPGMKIARNVGLFTK